MGVDDEAGFGIGGDHEPRRAGPGARLAALCAGDARVLTAGEAEVGLAANPRSEATCQLRGCHVVPPAARLVEGDDQGSVLPVRARLEPGDEVTDVRVFERGALVAGVAVLELGGLDP